jgi:hypothetical protein
MVFALPPLTAMFIGYPASSLAVYTAGAINRIESADGLASACSSRPDRTNMNAETHLAKTRKDSGMPEEERLIDYIGQLERHCKGRCALRIHLSLLAVQNRREQHIRAAANTFDSLIRLFDGALFTIGNSDLILVFRGANIPKIDEAVQKVRFLFSEDPLFVADPSKGASSFCTWYDLETEYGIFRRDAQNCVRTQKVRTLTGSRKAAALAPKPTVRSLIKLAGEEEMSIADYDDVERLLDTADLSAMIRQQPICALTRADPPQRVFDEIYVSIADLQKRLAQGKSLTGDRWLFQRLTRTLDRRVLKALTGATDRAPTNGISLNMNIATLLTQEFQEFDANLRTGARGTILLELNVLDVFGDIGAYVYARDLVQERGYRICIDGLTHLTAPFIDRSRLGADMIKIYWSPDIVSDPAGKQAEALSESVQDAGSARVVLCRCDDAKAVGAGLDLGISMYQGRQIDRMLKYGLTHA